MLLTCNGPIVYACFMLTYIISHHGAFGKQKPILKIFYAREYEDNNDSVKVMEYFNLCRINCHMLLDKVSENTGYV